MFACGGQSGDGRGEASMKRAALSTKRLVLGRPEALDRNSPSEAVPSSTIEPRGLKGKRPRREGTPAGASCLARRFTDGLLTYLASRHHLAGGTYDPTITPHHATVAGPKETAPAVAFSRRPDSIGPRGLHPPSRRHRGRNRG